MVEVIEISTLKDLPATVIEYRVVSADEVVRLFKAKYGREPRKVYFWQSVLKNWFKWFAE